MLSHGSAASASYYSRCPAHRRQDRRERRGRHPAGPRLDADTKEILGASFLGTSGDEAIHCVLDAMYAKAPYTVLQRAMHIHPTVSEFIPTILGDLTPLPEPISQRPAAA